MIRHLATLIICFALRADVWATVPRDAVLRDHCATVEVNAMFDEEGREVFTQLIFRNADHSIRAWRMLKQPNQMPLRDWDGGYVATWMDGETVRQVRCDGIKQTWTQGFDPEVDERESLPKEKRIGLRGEVQ